MRKLPLFAAFLVLAIPACDGGPRTYRVVGEVTWEGRPVLDGVINFLPLDGNVHPKSAKIVNGRYDARVPVGLMKVEIFADKDLGYSEAMHQNVKTRLIPPEYNSISQLTFEVQPHDDNAADYELSAKRE